MNLSQFVREFMSYVSGTAIILNLLLLPIIALRTGMEIGSYKVLLFFYILIAAIHASLTFISLPIFEPSPLGWIFYATVQRLPRELGSYFICSYSVTHIKMLMVLTFSFVYRYFAVCWPRQMKWFEKPQRLVVLVTIYVTVVFTCAYPIVTYFRLNKELAETLKVVSVGGLDLRLEDISYIGAPMFINGTVVIDTMLTLALWSGVMMAASGISIFCSIRILFFFRGAAFVHLSPANRSLQRRLFLLLALQTFVPLIFAFTPSVIGYFLAYLSIHAPKFTEVSSSLLPIAQFLDPIYIFVLIADYRYFIVKAIKKYVFGIQTNVVLPVSTIAGTSTTGADRVVLM